MAKEFSTITDFKGMSANIDVTKVSPGYLIDDSYNVLFNNDNTISKRKGFELLGDANTTNSGIYGSTDFTTFDGTERPIRVWNKRFEVLINGVWTFVKTLTGDNIFFAEHDLWDKDAKLAYLVFVEGLKSISKWNGASATVSSVTTNTITIEGVKSFQELGFEQPGRQEVEFSVINNDLSNGKGLSVTTTAGNTYSVTVVKQADEILTAQDIAANFNTAIGVNTDVLAVSEGYSIYLTSKNNNRITAFTITSDPERDAIKSDPASIHVNKVIIDDISYTYTGGTGTQTLTGVTPDPSMNVVATDLIFQDIMTINNTDILSYPEDYTNDVVQILDNQLYVGSLTNRFVYISEFGRIDCFHFSRPNRIVNEGAIITLGGKFNGMFSENNKMLIQFGDYKWIETRFINSADLKSQSLYINELDVETSSGVYNHNSFGRRKQKALFITKDNTLQELSRLPNMEGRKTKNISYNVDKIFKDVDFSVVDILTFKDSVYITAPKSNIILIYDLQRGLWQPPQKLAISRFSIIDGKLIGHSYHTPESYTLFTGNSDNGLPIQARLKLSYMDNGIREYVKSFDTTFIEGYVADGTTLNAKLYLDYLGDTMLSTKEIDFNEMNTIKNKDNDYSLGKSSLGKTSVGTGSTNVDGNNYFKAFLTWNSNDCYMYTIELYSENLEDDWSILSIGFNSEVSDLGLPVHYQ